MVNGHLIEWLFYVKPVIARDGATMCSWQRLKGRQEMDGALQHKSRDGMKEICRCALIRGVDITKLEGKLLEWGVYLAFCSIELEARAYIREAVSHKGRPVSSQPIGAERLVAADRLWVRVLWSVWSSHMQCTGRLSSCRAANSSNGLFIVIHINTSKYSSFKVIYQPTKSTLNWI